MPLQNTPPLETQRLLLRPFVAADLDAFYVLFRDEQVNTFLPWFPLSSLEEARDRLEADYLSTYFQPCGYRYAICLKSSPQPIGYMHVDTQDAHDFGYALRREFWHQGITTEAGRAVLAQVQSDGMPYVTATHDVKNPRSGHVMQRLGMQYQYSYVEQWQPKNYPVTFRMYQLNLDGHDERVYLKYWKQYAQHFKESGV